VHPIHAFRRDLALAWLLPRSDSQYECSTCSSRRLAGAGDRSCRPVSKPGTDNAPSGAGMLQVQRLVSPQQLHVRVRAAGSVARVLPDFASFDLATIA
jgi:hypothetical protein